MDYDLLLKVATELGYQLSVSGAETFRIEDSVTRVLRSYGLESEVYSVPNCLTVSIETPEGRPMTRMRRVGYHGNDLDAVEKFNMLSRWLCNRKPEPQKAMRWLQETKMHISSYNFPILMGANFLSGFGFCFLFGGDFMDALCAGACGLVIGIINRFMDILKTNQFVRTITASFFMAALAFTLGSLGIANNTDAAIIGSLMLLVPGLLFTNAMRDIMSGDTNSGINRIMQVLLIASAICLGTGAAWSLLTPIIGEPINAAVITYHLPFEVVAAFLGSYGFCILFNIHGPGTVLCAIGAALTWIAYRIALNLGSGDVMAYFWATLVAAGYSEAMARVRKCPVIPYLVVAIFPLIPGAGVYYTMNFAVRGDMVSFADKGVQTIAVAAIMAVGMLLVSTAVHLWTIWQQRSKK